MSDERVDKIRKSLIALDQEEKPFDDIHISYVAPWFNESKLKKHSIDLIFSQAVMEHVADLDSAYKHMKEWLKPNGIVSHQIDFKSHGYTSEWNGHWVCNDFKWKLIMGKKSYILNRAPHSKHLEYLNKNGFSLKCDKKVTSESKFTLKDLPEKFNFFTEDDIRQVEP